MNKAIKVLQKHAGLFSKKPKWLTDENWKDDEEAVNDWYSTWTGTGGSPKYLHDANKRALEMVSDDEILDLARKYNLNYRKKRVDDKTAYYLDKLQELGIISPKYHDYLLKQDRDDASYTAWFEAMNAMEENPDYEKIYKDFSWDDVDPDDLRDGPENMTPYGKDLLKLYEDIYNYNPSKDAPMTRTDTGSVEDATPYQLEKWKREAKQSALLAGLKGALGTGLKAGLASASIGGGLSAVMDPQVGFEGIGAGALLGGAIGGGVGSIYGGLRDFAKALKKKRNAKYRLNEEPIGKEASYKRAGLDNYWMAQNPETKNWDYADIPDVKSDQYGSIDPNWFRGKAYDDLVRAATHKTLYGMEYAPRLDENDDIWEDYYKEHPEARMPNWISNKQCKKIYKKLRKLNPKRLKELRKRCQNIYDIPDDEDVQAFVDQFKKHVNEGHSLLASY